MSRIKAIRSEADYGAALARIDALMDAETGTPEGEELDVLSDLVEHYEAKQLPMGFPGPIAAIQHRMEQSGLSQRDLIPLIGTRSKVSEVLSGRRQITMQMARALHEHLGIPAGVLLQHNLLREAGGIYTAERALFRKTGHTRTNAKADPYALKAWCWKVLAEAAKTARPNPYRRGSITLDVLRQLSRLS